MPQSDSRKKRKLSDLTSDDANLLLSALQSFQASLDDIDEELPPELNPALEKLREKLVVIPNTSFSKADPFTLTKLGIGAGPLFLREDKREEVVALGQLEAQGTLLSLHLTADLIRLVRNHVSLTTEAGCRMLINVVLLRLASTMQNEVSAVNIIPEFPVPKTVFEGEGTEGSRSSFSGVLDYLLACVNPKYSRFLLDNPVEALAKSTRIVGPLTPTIIEAKKDNLRVAVPQAAVAAASYCKQHGLSVIRGCITSGEEWLFFVYKDSDDVSGREICLATNITLGSDLQNLSLILGLLRDLVENALSHEQKYFSYE